MMPRFNVDTLLDSLREMTLLLISMIENEAKYEAILDVHKAAKLSDDYSTIHEVHHDTRCRFLNELSEIMRRLVEQSEQ